MLELLTVEQAQRIADYHADDALQERIEWLASGSEEGKLTEDETSEYEGYVRANRFLSILSARAMRKLAS